MAQEPWPKQVVYDQFLLFGDSLTQASHAPDGGFAASFGRDYIRKLDIINRGFSGYNTSQALQILPSIIPIPALPTIFLGANDACLSNYETKQHVPLATYAQNLDSILTHPSVKAQAPRIILITPPPVDEHQFVAIRRALGKDTIGRTALHTKTYADACRAVGRKHPDVAILDLWNLVMAKAGWREGQTLPGSWDLQQSNLLKEMLCDGLHFTPAAYQMLYGELSKLIAERWPDQTPERCELVFPLWMEAYPREEGVDQPDYH